MINEEKIRELSISINEIREDYVDYVAIYQCSRMLLEAVFGENFEAMFEKSESKEVDVRTVATELGISLLKQDLSFQCEYNGYKVSTILLRDLNSETIKLEEPVIFINPDCRTDYINISIGKMIYLYLKYYGDVRTCLEARAGLMCFEYELVEDIIAGVFARLLLLPPKIIQKEFEKFFSEAHEQLNNKHVKIWYEYLAYITNMQVEDAVIGWQEDRIVLKLLEMCN